MNGVLGKWCDTVIALGKPASSRQAAGFLAVLYRRLLAPTGLGPTTKSLLNYHCRHIPRVANSLFCSSTVSKKATNFSSVNWSDAANVGSRKCQLPHRPSSFNTLQAVGCELLVSSLGLLYAENTLTATTSLNVSQNDTCASMSQSSRRLQQHLWAGVATMFSP